MARAWPLVSFAVPLILLASSCADSSASDDDEGGDDPTLPDVDVALRCPAAEELPLQPLGPTLGGARIGPCGQLAYHDDEGQGWLVALDGSRTELDFQQLAFASSGDLLAWSPALAGGLRLRALPDGEERELIESDMVDRFGFVPSFVAPERSAWLWTCEQGSLARHDLASSEVVAEAVVCGSVVGSGGSPRIAYADQAGGVWLADLDRDLHIASDDLDYRGHDGSARDDTLWLDWDGQLLVHVAIEWQGDDDSDSEWPVSLWARMIDRHGAIVHDSPGALFWQHTPRRGAPVFVIDDGQLLRFDAGRGSSVASGHERSRLTNSGQLFFADHSGLLRIAERSPEAGLTTIGKFDMPIEISASAAGDAAAIEDLTEICIVDAQGECDRILLALSRWTKQAGLAERVLYSTTPWELLATLDDGRVLVIGAPVEVAGSTYEGEQPPARVLLLAADGEIAAEWPASAGALSVRQVFLLGPDRLLFDRHDEFGNGFLELVGPAGHSTLVDLGAQLQQVWIDLRRQRVAFISSDAGVHTLHYGSIPQG